MKKPALLSLIRIPPLCAIQRCTSGTGPLAANWGLFLFVEGVRWTEPKRSGSKKGGRRSARPKAIESSSQ